MKYISIKEIAEKLCIGKSTAWKYVKKDGFPQAIQLSESTTRWVENEVDEWVLAHR